MDATLEAPSVTLKVNTMRVSGPGTLLVVLVGCSSDPAPVIVTPTSDGGMTVVVTPDAAAGPWTSNNLKDGNESDVDCGGGSAPPCAEMKACYVATDCSTGVCSGKVCQAASFTDGVKNGMETDIDCGGAAPLPCNLGAKCAADKDCVAKNCAANVCVEAKTKDGIKNGTETDIDCGGPDSPACEVAKMCAIATDCTSKVCSGSICAAPSGTDNVQNGDETDVDCGGATSPKCTVGKRCIRGDDCNHGLCRSGTCPDFQRFDINHILSTGQSNSVANGGGPILSTTQPYNNVMFNTGVMTSLPSSCDGNGCRTYDTPSSFVPLIEGDRFFSSVNNITETMSAGLANEATLLAKQKYWPGSTVVTDFRTLVSLHGRSGNTYFCLRRTGCATWYVAQNYLQPFTQGMMEVQSAKQIAQAQGLSYAVRGVTAIHGESDNDNYNTSFPHAGSDGTTNKIRTYEDALVEWQQDYETEVKAITGQTVPVPLFISQMHGWVYAGGRTFSRVTRDQYNAHKRALGKVVIATPGYIFPFANDWIHYTNESQRKLGEYFAKATMHTVVTGQAWEPVRPSVVTLAGDEITVKFLVPTPPLVIDTNLVKPAANYGFAYTDDSGAPPAIQSVVLAGPDSVRIKLAAAPTGANKKVSYAYAWNGVAAKPGPDTGIRGNLRDSDMSPSQVGQPLYNWGVSFEEAIP